MMFANNWMGNNGNNPTTQNQIAALQNQIQDNHNSDLLMSALQGNKDAVQNIANVMNAEFNEVLNQIKALNSSLQIQLDTLDKVKSDKKSCEKLLADLDPDIKERQRVDGRLNKVEQKVTEISSDISEIKESLKKLLSK